MKTNELLKLYFVFSAIYLLALLFDFHLVASIAKVSLIPIIFFNYYFEKGKLALIPTLILACCFLGDVFMLNFNPVTVRLFLIFFGINHLIFSLICFRSIHDLDVKKLIFSAVPVIILWFIYFNYSIKDIFGEQMGDLYPFIIIYSIVLSAFTIISLVNFFNDESKINLYPVIISVCFLIGDIMMAIDNYIVKLFFFDITIVVVKVISYYFLLKFITSYNFKRLY
ncbi:lysoplasmalogenase family protein [Joostella sp.]|uniref:lysoplasmalogenase family protein n=1 Tax=Joostella sp. TaxID=2231138 RepID=UPI003A951058